jgi:hypothetical protein
MSDHRAIWTADDEIRSLRSMSLGNAAACMAYCRVILADGRRWDRTVDVAAVKAEARRLIGPPQRAA